MRLTRACSRPSFALAPLALRPAPDAPRYAAQQTTSAAPLAASFCLRFKRLWLLAGSRQYPRRLSRLQTSALKLPSLRHQKINLLRKGRRANSVVKPIFGVSANFALQIAALALCRFASSTRRPAKSAPNPAVYTSTQKSVRHVWHSRPMELHFQL